MVPHRQAQSRYRRRRSRDGRPGAGLRRARWDEELLEVHGPNVSIENSVAVTGNTVYFANSGGLLQGWDITGLATGVEPQRVFRFWLGDDTDASIVADDEGFLYAAVEYEKENQRSKEVGQLVKIDPTAPDDPIVWSVADRDGVPGGLWATPAVTDTMVYASTNTGRLLGVDRRSGDIVWEKRFGQPIWSSQVVVDDVLIQGDCAGLVHAYDVSDPTVDPPELWKLELGGCIESTPAVWDGRIIVGTREGRVHMFADPTRAE
ncbi:MAG: PQQ-binding-like beta-propeller repeat protein [Acidimicrobiales bacterium]